jgi:hypothetical protein
VGRPALWENQHGEATATSGDFAIVCGFVAGMRSLLTAEWHADTLQSIAKIAKPFPCTPFEINPFPSKEMSEG